MSLVHVVRKAGWLGLVGVGVLGLMLGGYAANASASFTPDRTGCTAVWNDGIASPSASATTIDAAVPHVDPFTELRFGVNPSASAQGGTYTGTITVIGN